MKSPLTIKYVDLISEVERILENSKATYPRLVTEGRMTANTKDHRIECHKQLLKLLKKHHKNPQLSMEDMFNRK